MSEREREKRERERERERGGQMCWEMGTLHFSVHSTVEF